MFVDFVSGSCVFALFWVFDGLRLTPDVWVGFYMVIVDCLVDCLGLFV